MWHLEKIEKMFCLLIKTSLFIFDMNTLPYDVLGIIVSLLPTPKDFSSFSLVNKKTRIATQTPYVLLEAKNRFAKRVYGECEKNFKTVLPNGTKHGEYNKYYVSGQLEIRCFWKDGKKEGEEMRWHENGQLQSRCFWRDGKKEGEEMMWHENGQLWSKCFWKDGKQEGEEIWWRKNGQLRSKYFWKNGEFMGSTTE
jgi:antitoxin component YwqK of YwqJK toxin-antitoxin module